MSRPWKLGLLLWSAGLAGVIAMCALVIPQLLARLPEVLGRPMPPLPLPTWMLAVANLVQTGILLALAVWTGVSLSPGAGLRAPAFEAAAASESVWPALRPQLLPGIVAGVLGGLVLALFSRVAPPAVQAAQERFVMPLIVRVLYGGITEEVLLRWGFMTALAWLAARFLRPGNRWMVAAIVVSAVVFAAGHLPAAGMIVGRLTPAVVGYVLLANSVFGVVFGWLYWRRGLEAAILAHAITHVVAYVLGA